MIRYISVLSFILITGCATKRSLDSQNNKFVEFVNDDKLGAKMDSDVIHDKTFKLQIPIGLLQTRSSVSYYFSHTLSFNNDQKIVTLYLLNKRDTTNFKSSDLTYRQFEELLNKENIMEELNEIHLNHRSHFGLNKIKGQFYVIYLNVKVNKVSTFNYSINSIQL